MAEDGVLVSSEQIYTLLMGIDKKVDRVEGKVDRLEASVATTQRTVDDHEIRMRSLEAHGSTKAQDNEKELITVRGRLHSVENAAALNAMELQKEEEDRKATKATLMRLVFVALSVAGTALATLIVSLVIYLVSN